MDDSEPGKSGGAGGGTWYETGDLTVIPDRVRRWRRSVPMEAPAGPVRARL